jgi:hypothetical protein
VIINSAQGDTGDQRAYLSYLLRLWCVGDAAKPLWRASLKSAHSGKQVGFASLQDLFDFLQVEIGLTTHEASMPSTVRSDRSACDTSQE